MTKYFVNSVGLGFDAHVVESAEKMGTVIKGKGWVYFMALAKSVATHTSKQLEMKSDRGTLLSDKIYTMSVANGPFTGGGIKQTPDADPTDGVFDIMAATRPSLTQLVGGLYSVLLRRNDGSVIKRFRAKEITIESTHRHKIEADGIVMEGAKTPVAISMVPWALNMIVP